MYGLGTEKETTKAIDYYLRAAELGNTNAKRSMAWEYILGKNIEQDIDKGIKLLAELAEGGDEYAKSTLQHIHDYKQTALANSILSLFAALSKLIEDDYIRNQRTLHSKADKKLRRMIEQKKEHLGIKSDSTLCYEQQQIIARGLMTRAILYWMVYGYVVVGMICWLLEMFYAIPSTLHFMHDNYVNSEYRADVYAICITS